MINMYSTKADAELLMKRLLANRRAEWEYTNPFDSKVEEAMAEIGFNAYSSHIQHDDLKNYDNRNPTYQEVIAFLNNDKTDLLPYVVGEFTCRDFAMNIYNNAKDIGLKCGRCSVMFKNESRGHGCNVWYTTDKGLIFTDSTGKRQDMQYEMRASGFDKLVRLRHDGLYEITYIGEDSWTCPWTNLVIDTIHVHW